MAMASPPHCPNPSTPGLTASVQGPNSRDCANSAGRFLNDDLRRPNRANSLRRVKDSHEALRARSNRARGGSSGNLDTNGPGRSFTVGNINNGFLYLRPVVRPGHQRTRPSVDPFVILPPTTPGQDNAAKPIKVLYTSDGGVKTTPVPETPQAPGKQSLSPSYPINVAETSKPKGIQKILFKRGHLRSRSFSTAEDPAITAHEPGTFKVVIDRPNAIRPRTAETPILQVPIPHYRLGTPQFSSGGSAILRSSIYTRASGTDDVRSSVVTQGRRGINSLLRPSYDSPYISQRHSVSSPQVYNRLTVPSAKASPSGRASAATIEPHLYDSAMTAPNDETHIRLNESGEILAATPSRLIAQITSPSFLDYELLSDFFLTFRSFLTCLEVVQYLMARLEWAVGRADDHGRIVRVRTFVALRHWILNYFADDFILDINLRESFCLSVNGLYKRLQFREDGGGGDLKIMGELKKCWRRTCATYWSPPTNSTELPDDDLRPGGADFLTRPYIAPQVSTAKTRSSGMGLPRREVAAIRNNPLTVKHIERFGQPVPVPRASPASSKRLSSGSHEDARPLSSSSERSVQALSCSIPVRSTTRSERGGDIPLTPHPILAPLPSSNPYSSIGRSGRPSQGHKRSGSFSDALRDVPHSSQAKVEHIATDNHGYTLPVLPGSLVRGAVYQPGSPYIDIRIQNNMVASTSNLDLDLATLHALHTSGKLGGISNNASVKKLIGTVRRALSSRLLQNPTQSTPSLNALDSSSFATRQSNPNTITATASHGSSYHGFKKKHGRVRPQVRVDVLAAKIGDSFRRAIMEEIQLEKSGRNSLLVANLGGLEPAIRQSLNVPRNISEEPGSLGRFHSGVTTGSRSILIVDDTGAPPLPEMSGALPSPNAERVTTQNYSRPVTTSIDSRVKSDMPSNIHISLSPEERDSAMPGYINSSDLASIARSADEPRRTLSTTTSGYAHSHSLFHRETSNASIRPPSSLRRYASYHSGFSKSMTQTFNSMRETTLSQAPTESSDNDPFRYEKAPANRLRRRPGGNLRNVDNVQDLEHTPRRRHSIGSMSVRTESVILQSPGRRSQGFIYNELPEQTVESAQLRLESLPQRRLSMVETHSSQPNMRPSFEVEVAKLRALPDDDDDDGGIESTLLKLEGKFERRSPSTREVSPVPMNVPHFTATSSLNLDGNQAPESTLRAQSLLPDSAKSSSSSSRANRLDAPNSIAESEDSYDSVPLLERGFSDVTASSRDRVTHINRGNSLHPPLGNSADLGRLPADKSSIIHEKTDSTKGFHKGAISPIADLSHNSFLLDDNEDFSEHSSDVPADFYQDSETGSDVRVRSFFDDEHADLDNDMTHPLHHPPTPPATLDNSTILTESEPSIRTAQYQNGLPTPGMTPPAQDVDQVFKQTDAGLAEAPAAPAPEKVTGAPTKPILHLPFIMAHSSEVLAQQFTVIEKDALDEIDWKELIELRWRQSSTSIQDWVEYLRTEYPHGVDVVIARFNLMVKWALSEIVLTSDIEERAKCLIKYIHIAAHTRKLRNYATMYQITVALLSSDCARLHRSWEYVPAVDRATLGELEVLVQPLRNFHALRMEMETASVEEGCIPFIGIYTRDLVYNAQKPAYIGTQVEGQEKMVNWERHHTAAAIVKSLLRLLESSGKYSFTPDPAVVSKCLWMAALTDEEIARKSRELE